MKMTGKGMSTTVPTLHFEASLQGNPHNATATMVIGKKASMESLLSKVLIDLGLQVPPSVVTAMIDALDEATGGSPSSTLLTMEDGSVHHLQVAGLPSKLSRHNHPFAVHTLTSLAPKAVVKGAEHCRLVVLSEDFSVAPLGLAVGKAFSLFSMKSTEAATTSTSKSLHVGFYDSSGSFVADSQQLQSAQVAAKCAQFTCRLVDAHPELLTTTEFSKQVSDWMQQEGFAVKIQMKEIIGKELETKGYGGLYNVGKAANRPPRLIVLEYDGSKGNAVETVALVGKGIVYDTGGLSLKVRRSAKR